MPCVDTVMFATGYCYTFPFLASLRDISVEDNRWLPWQPTWRLPASQPCTSGSSLLPHHLHLALCRAMLAPYLSECALCRVSPLYQHVFPPAYAPSLSFIGLPWKVVPFPQYELQAKWVARQPAVPRSHDGASSGIPDARSASPNRRSKQLSQHRTSQQCAIVQQSPNHAEDERRWLGRVGRHIGLLRNSGTRWCGQALHAPHGWRFTVEV